MNSGLKYELKIVIERLRNPPIEIILEKLEDALQLSKGHNERLWNRLLSNLETFINTILYPESDKVPETSLASANPASSCEQKVLENVQEFLLMVTQLAYVIMDAEEPDIPPSMNSLAFVMVELLSCQNVKVDIKAQTIKLCGLWLKKKIHMEERMLIKAFTFVVKHSLLPDALKVEVHFVWAFRSALKLVLDNETYYNEMKEVLLEVPVCKNFLKNKEGCNFIGFMMTLNIPFTLEVHNVIKKYLPVSRAEEYAPIYYYAWNSSTSEMKKVIEKECVQFFMLKSLTLPRHNLNMIIAGQNSLRILSQFHQQKQFPHVQKMLSTLYEPLLWRHLTSSNNIHRCNATEVLFDAYPLEKPGKGRQINEVFLNQQHDAISKLLTDTCHVVRIIAIRQVCKVLSSYWEAIPAETIHRWLKTICVLANDFSSFYVRRSVFKGLPVLLTNAHASLCLEQILPRFKKNFHDPNEQVRSAFVNMLLAVKAAKGKLKFWHIVPLEELVGRLEVENEVVGSKLVDLLFDSFFNPQFDEASIILRLVHLVALNCPASLKFFYFSKKRMALKPAVDMMLNIITFVRGYVKEKMEAAKEEKETSEPAKKKRKLFTGKESSISCDDSASNIVDSSDESSQTSITTTAGAEASTSASSAYNVTENGDEKPKEMPLDNPAITKGLLEIAGVLWRIHLKEIENNDHKKYRNKIFDVFEPCLNSFLQFFKNHTGLYSAVLGLCSFMPPSRLKYVSTVESSCVSQLKKMQWDNGPDKMLMFLVPLCMWGRGADVIELTREWLKETFKKANVSYGRRSSSNRRKVVNFKEATGPKPRLGLRLIDSILMIPRCKSKVLNQHSDELVQLWLYMGTIKELIDGRLVRGESFEDPDMSDTFLEECLDLYLTLMVTLDEVLHEEEPLNSVQEFKVIVEWALETLLLYVPSEVGEMIDNGDEDSPVVQPFSVRVLNIVIKYTTCLIPLGRVDLQLVRRLAILIKCALNTGSRILFVHFGCVFISYLIAFVKTFDKGDQLHLFRRVVLTLMKMVLNALTEHHMDQITIKRYIQDFTKIKCTMNEVLMFSQRHSSKLLQNVASMFVDATVDIIRTSMVADAFEEPVGKINSLPFTSAQVASLFVLRIPMAKVFCVGLEKHFANYLKNDVTYFMAALNLYYVLCYSNTKAQPENLLGVLSACKDTFKKEIMKQQSENSSSEIGLTDSVLNKDGKKLLGAIEEKLLGASASVSANVVQNLLDELNKCNDQCEK